MHHYSALFLKACGLLENSDEILMQSSEFHQVLQKQEYANDAESQA